MKTHVLDVLNIVTRYATIARIKATSSATVLNGKQIILLERAKKILSSKSWLLWHAIRQLLKNFLNQALEAMEEDDESVEWLLSLWFVKLLSAYIIKMIMDKMCITDSWLNVSCDFYHLHLHHWIKDQISYLKKVKASRRKELSKYYFKSCKRQFIGELKPKKHKRQGIGELKLRYKATKVNAFNTIVYKSSISKTISKEHWDQESYPIKTK